MDRHHISHSIYVYTNSSSVFEQSVQFDMAFLDIEMPGINGIELAKKLRKQNPKIIIFIITAFNQYLDDAFDLSAFRFIQKPLDIPRFFSGLDKAMDRLDRETIPFFLQSKNETVRIFSSDILYVEIVKRHTEVVTSTARYSSNNTISYWHTHLPATSFYRVHSSFIVNMKFVEKYARDHVTMDNNDIIPIAYRKQSAFKQYFSEYCCN